MKLFRTVLISWIALSATTIELSTPIPPVPAQGGSACACSCAPDGTSQEAAIESTVRRHRPTAGDAWIRTLTEAICVESLSADVDPLMTASIIASESSFRGGVVSRAGAVGLMQLRPFVARDIAERRQVAWNGVETLYAPRLNVRLGVLYFNELLERFGGDLQKALTAYNYGPTRVSRMIRAGEYGGSRYAEAILERYERLRASASAPSDERELDASRPRTRAAYRLRVSSTVAAG